MAAQPYAPGQGVGPLGGFRTTDSGGPYNISLLSQQANEVAQGGILPNCVVPNHNDQYESFASVLLDSKSEQPFLAICDAPF